MKKYNVLIFTAFNAGFYSCPDVMIYPCFALCCFDFCRLLTSES